MTLAPTLAAEFSGTALPAGWSGATWGAGGGASVSGGSLVVDGARAVTDLPGFGPGRSLEFVATFGAAQFQHVGLVSDFYSEPPWILVSTRGTTDTLFARTTTNPDEDVAIPNVSPGTPHHFRIEWAATEIRFFVNGGLVATRATTIGQDLRLIASDFNAGGPNLSVDWLRLSPYTSPCTFTSRVFDAGSQADWGDLSWSEDTPRARTSRSRSAPATPPPPTGPGLPSPPSPPPATTSPPPPATSSTEPC